MPQEEQTRKPFVYKLYIGAGTACLVITLAVFIGLNLYRASELESAFGKNAAPAGAEVPVSPDPLVSKVVYDEDLIVEPIINGQDPSAGPDNAAATVVIFSDYQCEYCKENELALKELLKDLTLSLKVVWKDYPDNDPSSYSWKAAIAARCAQEQDAFMEYHSRLLDREDRNGDEAAFTEIARGLNMDLPAFKDCYGNSKTEKLVLDNIFEANALKITGVPFMFINGKEFLGPMDIAELKDAINHLSAVGGKDEAQS